MEKERIFHIVTAITVIFIVVLMITPLKNALKYDGKESYCEVTSCSKTTLDHFDSCIELGYESSGFLSGNYYYLCDGEKVTKSCVEYGMEEVKKGDYLFWYFGRGMECEKVNKESKK